MERVPIPIPLLFTSCPISIKKLRWQMKASDCISRLSPILNVRVADRRVIHNPLFVDHGPYRSNHRTSHGV